MASSCGSDHDAQINELQQYGRRNPWTKRNSANGNKLLFGAGFTGARSAEPLMPT